MKVSRDSDIAAHELHCSAKKRSPSPRLKTIALLVLLACGDLAHGTDFPIEAAFPTLEAMQSALKGYTPSTSSGALRADFSLPEPGEISVGETRATRTATPLVECVQLWVGDESALIYVSARPPTESTPSEVGVVFFIVHRGGSWRVADRQRFVAFGKYAKVVAEITSAGHKPKVTPSPPIFTIREFQGGRGYSYDVSASYTIKDQKIIRHDVHQ